jgi:chemotaxis protein CheX
MTVGTAPEVVLTPEFTTEDLVAVAGQVWESCLVHHPDQLVEGPYAVLEGPVTRAWVVIRGGWSGFVVLEMGSGTAEEAARVMLDLEERDDVERDEVADAVGELVNIIGGNVKSLLPTASSLGLPQVGRAAPAIVVEHCRVDLWWGPRPVVVRVCS